MAETIVPLERQRKLVDVAARVREQLGLQNAALMQASELRDRSTHTGLQAMSTITGLVDLLASKASTESVAAAIADLVNSSPAALDTLQELAAALGNDPNFAATVSAALGNRLRVDAAQALSGAQKNQAAANIGIAPGATANATDADLRARASHTGEQAMSTVTGLVAALASKATPADIAVAIAGLVDSAPGALDTLKEFADALGNDPNFAATISTALGNRLRVDAAQALTTGQKNQAAANLGIAPGATANDTDANLKSRANHTGTQGVDTISGIGEWVEDRVAGLLEAGPNITLDYDDVAGRLTIGATGDLNTTAESTTFVPAGGLTSTNVQGALSELGSFKLNEMSGAVQSGEDLNDLKDNLRMVIAPTGVLNHPEPGSYMWLDSWFDGNSCTQYARGVYHNSEYRRYGNATTNYWEPWTQLTNQGGHDPTSVNRGGDAMYGDLLIAKDYPNLLLRALNPANPAVVTFRRDDDTTSGVLVAQRDGNLQYGVYGPDGAWRGTPFEIDTGNLAFTTPTGFKWIRSVNLPYGTDLDTVTQGGTYFVQTTTNAPNQANFEAFLRVESAYGTDSLVTQEYHMPYNANYSGRPAKWVRRRHSGFWGAWYPEGGWITPEHFSAAGDGSADDTLAVAAALRFPAPVLLAGLYRLTGPVHFGVGYNSEPLPNVLIQGKGQRAFYLATADAGLVFHTGEAQVIGGRASITARDFVGICGVSNHTTALLKVEGGLGSGSTEKTFDIRNVHSFGDAHDAAPLYGIHLHNGRNGVIDGTVHQGKRNGVPGSMEGAAVYLTGGEDPVGINITNWKAYFCQAGVNIQDTHEGIEVSSGEAVMVDYGVLADLDETVPSGNDEGKPLLKVVNNHFNVHRYGVFMNDVRDFNITNNDFLFQGSGAKIGIWVNARSTATLYGEISGNKFDGSNSTGSVTGIWCQGFSGGGTLGTHVGLNRYVLLSYGLYLGDHARGVTYHGASIYAAVGTTVYASGSSSGILRYGVPAAV
ncbi:hypothetical protein [Shinella zoogloeoides]|uniref:hypothetical protein n=1 Tax=Shinella zoogloeoides TaxID=352475 RepID=UPI00273E2735|nr:hypothetical protein [Shinella zoogloeoides]WLR92952.1 hypothetical protein Q9316_01710 [Shinella zoogloeoides]